MNRFTVVSTPRTDHDSETGAALIIALVLLILGSFVVVALATQATTNLVDTSSLNGSRGLEYAADGAMDGAIQQGRYHNTKATACESFPTTGTLKLSSAYIYVSCVATPFTASVATGANVITTSTPSFVPQDVGQDVFDSANPGSPAIPNGTTITAVTSSTQATISATATGSSTGLLVGSAGQRVAAFSACASTTTISSCPSQTAAINAVVTYEDTNSQGQPSNGQTATVNSWVIHDANS